MLVRAVKEIAEESGIKLDTFSQDWILSLEKDNRIRHIFGYNFDLNGASGQLITQDKCAASELLKHTGIPAVEHRLFLRPNLAGYVASEGNWREMLSYFQRNDSDIVCKSNVGTGGHEVYRARTFLELERSVHKLFSSNRAIALSPFINIESEYRLLILGRTCELAYEKVRPKILGDGYSTLSEIILKNSPAIDLAVNLIAELSQEDSALLSSIPKQGEWITLSWKHNLGKGAKAVEISDEMLKNSLSAIALSCMDALNLSFVSVDIVRAESEFSVMEINSGIMMESYSRQGEREYEKTKEIYRKAIMSMLSRP